MKTMSNGKRVKVILHNRDGWGGDKQLSLTPDQVRLMYWMFDRGFIDVDTWDLQELEESEVWEEI